MASFASRPLRPWSVEEHAVFAARKEFELLKLLATDKKALATARRLSAFRPHPQPPSPAVADGARKAAAAPPPVAAAPTASAAAPNSRQRRSASRSAKRHAAQRARSLSRSMLAILFIVRLRRIVDGTLGFPGGPADVGAPSGSAKRGPAERPNSSNSNSSSASSSRSSDSEMRLVTLGDTSSGNGGDALLMPPPPPRPSGGAGGKKQKGGLLTGFLLR
jgi:pyruvate/2-oxoglutarate dehydrogenase complex dihydrolipoamide acyltransferase (E2) component